MKGTYYSEDWAFCHKARDAGYDVRVNMDVYCNHVGNHVFQVNGRLPVDQAPEVYRPLLYRIQGASDGELIKIDKSIKEIVGEEIRVKQKVVMSPKSDVMDVNAEVSP